MAFRSVLFLALIVLSSSVIVSLTYGQATTWQGSFTGHENHSINLDLAKKLLTNYRSTAVAGNPWGEYFGRDAVTALLNQPGCVGMRVNYAKNDMGTPILVIVGVDSNGNDLTQGLIVEIGLLCPPFCDTTRVLGN